MQEEETPTPKTIWIITGASDETSSDRGSRTSVNDIGGLLATETEVPEVTVTRRKTVDVAKLKREMKGFLQAMRETLDEADPPDSRMTLDEVELSVEINGEGEVSLFGIGGKAGGKGGMTFKFKRKDV